MSTAALGIISLFAPLLAMVVTAQPAAAAPGPTPILTFYVPMFEDDYMEALRSIDTGSPNPIGTNARDTISITVASAGAVLYYDQWENGYETTINDPTVVSGAGATLVWGDGNAANGDVTPFCPRCSGDTIPAGGVINLNNSLLPGASGAPTSTPAAVATPRVSGNVFWDGRDKISSTRGIHVSQAVWGEANALASGAVSVLDTNRWGNHYIVPIGQDSAFLGGSSPSEYSAVSVMARFPNTTVQIDGNDDGDLLDAVDRNTTLSEGQTLFVDGGILEGASITSSQPTQANLYVGDINADYEVSFLELIPVSGFNTSYIAPASVYNTNYATVVYLYNPNGATLAITRQTSAGSTVFNVPANSSLPIRLDNPLGGAAVLTASSPFLAEALVGAASGSGGTTDGSADYDWGYAPVPTGFLTPAIVVGWAPGSQDGSDLNASAVWVTSASATTLYVDFDGNPATGANSYPDTGICSSSEHYDTTVSITALESRRIVDADGDMTGARITTCDLNVRLSAAYGEDPDNAAAGFPGLDLGTAQFPAPSMATGKLSSLVIDVDGDGTADPGDTIEWTATIADAGASSLTNTVVTDTLPTGLNYVTASTTRSNNGGAPFAVADNTTPATAFPLDESGLTVGSISPGATVTLTYRTTIASPPPVGTLIINNIVCGNADQAVDCASGSVLIGQPGTISDRVWSDTDSDGIQDAGETTGIDGVTVRLYLDANADGSPDGAAIATTTSAGGGLYSFTNLDDTTNYIVEFVAPSGRVFSPANSGANDALDSDANRTTGRTGTIALASGEVITHVDAGLILTATISDRVWEDTDRDGIQDAGETTGLNGVTVTLYLDANADGTPDGAAIATTTTAGGGLYSFSDLDPIPNYVVEFALTGGRAFSPADQGGDDNVDSDANIGTGRTPTINPSAGQVITNVDAGFQPAAITITKTSNANADGGATVAPGDSLSYTITVSNPGPSALNNIVVTDTLPAGLTWSSTSVTRPVSVSSTPAADDFASGGYSGGTGWPVGQNWTELGGDGGAANAGDVQVTSQTVTYLCTTFGCDTESGKGLSRVIGNTTAFTGGSLTIAARCSSFDNGNDAVALQVRPNGSSAWRTLRTWTGASPTCNNGTLQTETFNLTAADIGTATEMRVVATADLEANDTFFFDNVNVTMTSRTTSTVAGGAPPSLVTLTDLLAGESATITVNTTVDSPLSTSITSISNTATADPTETTPVSAIVTDPVAPGVISNLVFNDYDADGIQDAGEAGVDGVTVQLYDSTGTTVLQSTTTVGGGLYSFSVPAGTYVVRFTALANTVLTLADEGGNDNVDSDANASTGFTGSIVVAAGETRTDVDAGLRGTGSIGDTIFNDLNGNGSPDSGEGLAGVGVTVVWAGPDGNLATAGDNQTYTTTTGAGGAYLVSNLPAGSFRVTVTTASGPISTLGLTNTVDPDGGNDSTATLTLAAGASNLAQDFGYRGTGQIGDTIFNDLNGNGSPDSGEGLSGVGVTVVWAGADGSLATTGDNATFTTSTNASGFYGVTNLPAGTYSVTVTTASGPILSFGLTNTVDPDGGNDSTSTLSLAAGGSNLAQDFGYRGTGQIGDTIFNDLNGNGSPDSGEGLAGVGVTVVGAGADGSLATTGDNATFTTSTNASGIYGVSNLPAGTYSVTVTTASGPILSFGLTNTVDPDGGNDSTSTLSLGVGASNLLQDFGYRGTGSIGDTIYDDLNGNGSPDSGEGLAGVGVTVVWAGPDNNLATTADNQTYTTTTDASGNYLVGNLPGGNFQVTVTTASGPISTLGLTNTVDPDGGNDSTSTLTLATGGSNLAQDFGYRGTGSIGDTIFNDLNGNGSPDSGEGLAGVGVTVVWAGPDNNLATTADNQTYTTTTDASGVYGVGGLHAGTYSVTVTTASGPLSTLGLTNTVDPDGGNDSTATLTLAAGGSNLAQDFGYRGTGSIGDTIFNDLNGNGSPDSGEGLSGVGVSVVWAGPDGNLATAGDNATFTTTTGAGGAYLVDHLPAGDFRVTVTSASGPVSTLGLTNTVDPDGGNNSTATLSLAAGESNLAQDFGYRGTAQIAGRVYFDADADGTRDGGEPGISGVTVTLEDDGGATVATTTTAANGTYSFTNLTAGTYTVVETQPAAYNNGTATAGSAGGNASSATDTISTIVLAAGTSGTDYDFGELGAPISGRVYQDTTNVGIGGVLLTLKDSGGATIATTTTASNGTYSFANVPPGSYTIEETQPAGWNEGDVVPTDVRSVTHTKAGTTGEDFSENLPPTAVDDWITANANTPKLVTVRSNDTDPESETVTVIAITQPKSGGTSVINPGSLDVTYTAPKNFTGYDTFTYTIADGHGGTSTATVHVYISSTGLLINDKMFFNALGGTTPTPAPGSTPGTYDQQTTGGALTLSSQQLVLSTRNGFVPTPGQTFDVVVAGSITGAHSAIFGQVLPNGVFLDVRYLSNRVQVVAMSSIAVDTTTDAVDAAPGDGICATSAGTCSLRAAVQTANARSGADAVLLAPNTTYQLTLTGRDEDAAATGDLDLAGGTAIFGQNATINANGVDRALQVHSGVSLTMSKLTITGGNVETAADPIGGAIKSDGTIAATDVVVTNSRAITGGGLAAIGGSATWVRGSFSGNQATTGGGIHAAATVTLESVAVNTNTATGLGGGLSTGAGGSLTLNNSTVTGNGASQGGGIGTAASSTVVLNKSTIKTSSASSQGGGLYNGGTATLTDVRVNGSSAPSGAGIYNAGTLNGFRVTADANTATGAGGGIANQGTLTLTTSTLAGNSATSGAGAALLTGSATLSSVTVAANPTSGGGAVAVTAGATGTFANSIVADNAGGPQCVQPSGGLSSTGYNHASDATCAFTGTGDVQTGSALLKPLQSNGGYGPTMVPNATSPVVNTGATTCGSTDQRNFARPRGARCEKGAVEL